ncbi:hypothetical protein [Methylocystis bryophila]|uniref:Uncharacterized protein n=1 Tax=Methylocystis bryophila TaxID=655015 RepID=A0A1W6MTI6_9HYPH|nr:hypothetical protein [Methylocystis bryophila]ARN80921.1 hypothetical protein B1812_07360 [Methylocystis bryophila]BDV36821.1 hypothetical protein DSM21852_00740 [Methylocystis bryophila]
MNAPLNHTVICEHVASEAELIALDGIVEFASVLCMQSTALLAAAATSDVLATGERLLTCHRALTAAIACWREADPALSSNEGSVA